MNRIVFLACLLIPIAAAAQMYKWIDEKGVTHYSETPPPDGKAAKVDIRPATGASSTSAGGDWKQKELDSKQQRIQKDQNEQQEQKQSSARYNNCAEAQRQLAIAQQPRPLYQVNDKGEKISLDDKDRDREIAGWQANVKKYCE
jgi:hypothetical protein